MRSIRAFVFTYSHETSELISYNHHNPPTLTVRHVIAHSLRRALRLIHKLIIQSGPYRNVSRSFRQDRGIDWNSSVWLCVMKRNGTFYPWIDIPYHLQPAAATTDRQVKSVALFECQPFLGVYRAHSEDTPSNDNCLNKSLSPHDNDFASGRRCVSMRRTFRIIDYIDKGHAPELNG